MEGKEKDRENTDMFSKCALLAALWATKEANAWKELLVKSLKTAHKYRLKHVQK